MLRDTRELGSALLILCRRPIARFAIVMIVSASALVACTAPHKLVSARHTACPVRKIEVRDLVTQPQREDWIAVCGTQSYACFTREQGRRLIYGCRPLAVSSTPDASVAAPVDASVAAPVDAGVAAPEASLAAPVFTPASAAEAGAPDGGAP